MTQLPEPRKTNRHIRHIERLLRQQGTVFACITPFMEILMAGQAELNAEIAALKQAVIDDQAADQAVVDSLDQIIADLKASGDTSAAIAALEDVKAQISTVKSPNQP